jgi:hypothetical protein
MMKTQKNRSAFGTGSSVVVEECQVCGSKKLESIFFLGYLPPVNEMHLVGERLHEQPSYPAQLFRCPKCQLVQLGLIVDPKVLFPKSYPYTSSTTKVLRDNFAELYSECKSLLDLGSDDLIVDIGSNDGNLLSNFKDNHRVLGVTPEKIGKIAIQRGIPTILDYFRPEVVRRILSKHGKARVVTATNVFAHIEKPNDILRLICRLLSKGGVFISESHYLLRLVKTLQYDTIYHEHLRYYSLHSLKYLLEQNGLEIFHAKEIPSHGGSIRVYAARKGTFPIMESVRTILTMEKTSLSPEKLCDFKESVVKSKLRLYTLLSDIKTRDKKIYGVGAPSRASTLINYVGLDDGILDCVLEVKGSHKVGKYVPGTLIPVVDEVRLFEDQPEYALLLSWHIADELMPKLTAKGFRGDYIIPLPVPLIVRAAEKQ